MSEPTQISLNENPKRKNKLPIILLILVVILGIVIWRMKSAGGGSAVAVSSDTVSQPVAPAPESAKPETTAVVSPAAPSATPPAPEPVTEVVKEKPVHAVKHHKAPALASESTPKSEPVVAAPKPEPKASKSEPVVQAEPKSVEPVIEESKPVAPAPKPEPKTVKPEPVAKAESKPVPTPVPVAPKEAVKAPVTTSENKAATPAPTATTPAKKFALEDQPLSATTTLSEESKLAVNTQPVTESKSEAVASSPDVSNEFKKGMDAYKKQDYATAVQQFKLLPKPTSKQRGNPVRDQYVEGNFLLGLSLLRTDHADEAAKAFLAVLEYEKYYPLANMNLGICYVELKQYFKANRAFEAVIRDQSYIDPSMFDDAMQRTKYFWALAWTRMYKTSKDPDKQKFFQQQAMQHWKDYQTWFGKNAKYRAENRRAEDYIRGLSAQ